MVMLNLMPCSNCLHYNGIKQPKKQEKNEYIACKISKSGNADELLEFNGNTAFCRFQKKEDLGEY